jgi:CO/xanthine dehydrogenase Mo-binding subunit
MMGVPARSPAPQERRGLGRQEVGSYGAIVAKGDLAQQCSAEDLAKMPIKTPANRKLIGRAAPARDIPGKTTGAGIYGLDAKVPGMVYARPVLPPTRYASRVELVDDTAAKKIPGYIRFKALDDPSKTVPGWVVVYADSFPAADKAARALKVTYSRRTEAKTVSEADLQARARALIADKTTGGLAVEDPGVDAAFAAAKMTHEATYTTATALHFQMEPVNALAFEKDGMFEIHTGNQWQSLVLPWLAQALGRKEETIVLRTYLLGGGFGTRLNGDYCGGRGARPPRPSAASR